MFVVFQCRHCDAIVGDATDWLKAVKDIDSIALGNITEGSVYVEKEPVRVTSQFRIDRGAEYLPLHCSKCDAVLGLYYLSTGRFDDDLRNSYLLHISELKSYQIPVLRMPSVDPGSPQKA
ncbi:Kinetochore protein mis18 [Wickerhamiella sorbophila]|uniref:Protein yippee-like n=1 Tax=Wickerhamiella sorbophila TaxID=45607 RepID=A0A2T0FBM5_9ASCO|nr:Kinetochore protein mis18 [Wickerhamiella sorbophila]PRT52412.1 Kinetochore protein mis18 [Wickerhamiella sorbophila]